YRHSAGKELDLSKGDQQNMPDEDIRLNLLRKWYNDYCYGMQGKAESLDEQPLLTALDACGGCLLHRLRMFKDVADLGGLHVIGTERHEARRIDNQLGGRSGRQG